MAGRDAEGLYVGAERAFEEGRRDDALRLVDRALADRPGPPLRSRILQLRARLEVWFEAPLRAHELLLTEAAALAESDPSTCVSMLVEAAWAALAAGQFDIGLATSKRAQDLAGDRAPDVESLALVAHGLALAQSGETGRGWAMAGAAVRRLGPTELQKSWNSLVRAASILFWLEEYEQARVLLEQLIDHARSRGLRVFLAQALDTLAAVDFRTGHWVAADARSAEALRLARQLGQTHQVGSCLTTLACIAAARGDVDGVEALAREAVDVAGDGFPVAAWAKAALGQIELSQGRPERAIAVLAPLHAAVPQPDPVLVPWMHDLVEAYVRADRVDDARPVAAMLELRARGTSVSGLAALASRCRALTAVDGSFVGHFEEALRQHARRPIPFERARTELCYGERLRRGRRPRDAKHHLELALAGFEQLGARLWSDRARAELSTGRRAKRGPAPLRDLLTPHELEVALLVCRGATNRETASALFVSPKTIEYHLASIYRKLDLRSRTELAALLARET
jgi:DNA-binding CsgD family transcriptional regulator